MADDKNLRPLYSHLYFVQNETDSRMEMRIMIPEVFGKDAEDYRVMCSIPISLYEIPGVPQLFAEAGAKIAQQYLAVACNIQFEGGLQTVVVDKNPSN